MFNTIATYIIGVLVAWICAAGAVLIHKHIPLATQAKIKAEWEAAEAEIAAKQGIAYDAVRLAEDTFVSLAGPAKLQKAVAWAAGKLTKMGIVVTPAEITELCQIAYQDFKTAQPSTATPAAPAK